MLQPPRASGASPYTLPRHPLFRSYGVNLPSSLTWFLSRTLGFSPHLPVSVSVRSPCHQRLEAFLVSVVTVNSSIRGSTDLTPLGLTCCGFANNTSYGLRPTISAVGSPDLLRPSITHARWYWNINQLSIDYAFRPCLRVRLTPGGRTFPGNP